MSKWGVNGPHTLLVGMQNGTLENSLAISYKKHTLKYDPAVYSCMQMFTEALFITAKTWKQYKYPTTNE